MRKLNSPTTTTTTVRIHEKFTQDGRSCWLFSNEDSWEESSPLLANTLYRDSLFMLENGPNPFTLKTSRGYFKLAEIDQ